MTDDIKAAATQPAAPAQVAGSDFASGVAAAVKYVETLRHNFYDDHGAIPCPETGAIEFRGAAEEYVSTLAEIEEGLRKLVDSASPGAGSEDGMLPDALVPHATEWYQLCERSGTVDRIRISGGLAEAIVKAVVDSASPGAADEFAELDRETGRRWREDSSLETWFPCTAENLASQERMFGAACASLGAIGAAIGLDPETDPDGILDAIEDMQRALSAWEPGAAVVPDDWQIVPRKPTPEMIRAATGLHEGRVLPHAYYRAMLHAAPRFDAQPAPSAGETA